MLVVCVNKILNFYFVSTESTHQIRKAHILFLHLVYNLIAQGCDGLNFCFLLGIKEKYILCFFWKLMRYEGVLTKCYYVDVTASTAYKNNEKKNHVSNSFNKKNRTQFRTLRYI